MSVIRKWAVLLTTSLALLGCVSNNEKVDTAKQADKPLYRDTIYDGAADPIVIWNKKENRWFMFYTNRRANIEVANEVDWVHGTSIGIAESTDGGATWQYRANANIRYGREDYTYWAPDVIEDNGSYHMYLTVVPGTFSDWNHPRDIVHFTSDNLMDWKEESVLTLASDRVIDAGVFKGNDDWWYMYYNNERDGKSIYSARSKDLYEWEDLGKAFDGQAGEGPKVFYWHDRYFMIIDHWDGLGVYSSTNLKEWQRQPENILREPGKGPDDGTKGLHADVVVQGDKAYIFYFTHPGRTVENDGGAGAANETYNVRRSSIQVAELEFNDGLIHCDRDKPVYIQLKK